MVGDALPRYGPDGAVISAAPLPGERRSGGGSSAAARAWRPLRAVRGLRALLGRLRAGACRGLQGRPCAASAPPARGPELWGTSGGGRGAGAQAGGGPSGPGLSAEPSLPAAAAAAAPGAAGLLCLVRGF